MDYIYTNGCPAGSSNSKPVTFLALPTELILQILSRVAWSDYYSIRNTSRLLRYLADLPNSLSESRYDHLHTHTHPSATAAASPPPEPSFLPLYSGPSVKLHQIFSRAGYRLGTAYYSISIPSDNLSHKIVDIPISTSPFCSDAFSDPSNHKVVISWAHVRSRRPLGAIDGVGPEGYFLIPHDRALYINNLLVGTGGGNRSLVSSDIFNNRRDLGPSPYITVKDVFDAFERDHPDLKSRQGGRAEIVGLHHVFHPRAGIGGGSHFEVRWTWIDD
ncbi:hypothetical protein ABW19_dt0203972 [Dactylella cylindrospora]|nr:hypothetical protein ABW19_dt0203972 [Dactylella cylindrospora]